MGQASRKIKQDKKSNNEIQHERRKQPSSRMESTCSSEVMAFSQGSNNLATGLHLLLAEDKGNVFFSPFSIFTIIAMLFCAAEGETEKEIRKALGLEENIKKEEMISAFRQQLSELTKNPDFYTFSSANSMLTQKNFEVKEKYRSTIMKDFDALLLEEDFHVDADNIVVKINDWVKEKTSNMIPNLIDSLDSSTVMVLLNAVYFKGNWYEEFDEALTTPGEFYNNGNEDDAKTVDMMHIKETFIYCETNSFKALQLPYTGGEIIMLLLLPLKRNGLEELEGKITPPFFNDLFSRVYSEEVEISLPRFRLEYSKSLVPCLEKMGITKLFRKGAELGGASDSRELLVSNIFHKSLLEVNEKGCRVATCTMACIQKVADFGPYCFVADHPFLFVIYEKKSSLILFMGRVTEL